MTASLICRDCPDRPEGCWKAQEYGCACERSKAEAAATECPLGKWTKTLDLREIPGRIYAGPGRPILLTDIPDAWKVFRGEKFYGDFRVQVAHDYGWLLAQKSAPFLLLEDDCVATGPIGELDYPADADILMLGGGKRGVGRGHFKHGAKRRHGYSYEEAGDWIRVWGMLYTHAFLYLTQKAIDLTAATLATAKRPGDQLTAILQHELTVYCLKEPLMIQRGNSETWGYWGHPPPWAHSEPTKHHLIQRMHRRLKNV